jgi:hypothetical protein
MLYGVRINALRVLATARKVWLPTCDDANAAARAA